MTGSPSGLGPAELQRRVARGATWSAISATVSLPLAIVVSVVLARSLGPSEFARFAYLSFLVPLLINLLDLGFGHATGRAASQAFAAGDLEGTRDVVSKMLGWSLLRLPFVCAVVVAFARPGLVAAVIAVAGITLLLAGSGLLFALQAENRGAVSAKLAFLQGVVSGVLGMAVAAAGGSGSMVWAVTLASSAVALPGWLLVANPALRRAALTPKLPRRLPAGFWRYGLNALALALVSTLVFSRSEVVILEALGEHQALAVFALAFGLAQRLTTPVDTLLGPLIPALSALATAHPDRMRAAFGRTLRLSSVGVAFVTAAAVIGTMLAAPVLFGPEYEGTGTAFAALALASLLQSGAQPYIAVAHAVGGLGALIRANGIALAADVALALALIPPLGVWGAVLANVGGSLIALVLAVRAVPVDDSIRGAGVLVGRLLTVTVLSLGAAYATGLLGGMADPAVGALAAFAAGTACFLLLARIAGGVLHEGDAQVLVDVLPGRMTRFSRVLLPVVPSGSADAAR